MKLETGNNAEIDIWIPSISVGIEYDGSIHRKKSIYEKDLEKNRIIIESEYCNRLYRIRENITHEMEECSEKIKILKADDTISLTSRRGIIQLEKMIIELLAMLGVENPEVKITDQILNLCRNKVDEYYVAEGLPTRRKRLGNGKSNTKIFKKRVYNLVGDEYEVVSEYNTALTDISIKHNKCNRVYTTRPNSFLSGRRCPYCARKGQYTTSIYMDRLYETVGDEYSMVGEYINSKTKVVLKHNKCGCEFQKYPSHFLARPCCPICTGKIFI